MNRVSVTTARGKSAPRPTLNSNTKGRSLRALRSVDTDLNSYDRTDPFTAFNTLLKLLQSLPLRIGGCQYRLTAEEHKLSLHLINIVEPFVGLSVAPSRLTLIRQPTEILDHIAFHVHDRNDVAALGLACKRLHNVVYPRHIDYRVIKSKVSSISVWNHLMIHKSLARNVRRLEILDERSSQQEIIPSTILTSDTDLESTDDELGLHAKQERYLVAALTKMTTLHSFTWSCNHSPISIDNVWPTLLKCRSLRDIEIDDNLVFGPLRSESEEEAGAEAETGSSQVERRPRLLSNLKSVAVRSTKGHYGASKHPALTRISGMLNRCPNLESLNIAYTNPRSIPGATNPSPDDLLLYSRWPLLTSLTLTNLRSNTIAGLDATATFLAAHVNLEILTFQVAGLGAAGSSTAPGLVLPHNSLPRLRELRSNKEVASAILECSCDASRPLETLKGVRLSGIHPSQAIPGTTVDQDSTFLLNLRKYGKSIKRIELAGWNEMEDIKRLAVSAPTLAWLDIGKKSSAGGAPPPQHGPASSSKDKSILPVNNTLEWASILSVMPELTTFHGVKFFYSMSDYAHAPNRKIEELAASDRSRYRKNEEIANVLAWKCRKLRRMDHWEEGTGKIIVFVRDSTSGGSNIAPEKEKVRWETRKVKI